MNAETEPLVPRTWVPGRPASYSTANSVPWGAALGAALGRFRNLAATSAGEELRYEVILDFLVFPQDPAYRNQRILRDHGPDLDNLVKATIDFLADKKAGDGLRILWSDAAVYRIVATKEIVEAAAEAGASIEVRAL